MTPALVASRVNVPQDYNTNNDFDIRTVGIIDDGNLRLTVDGTAGASIPDGA